MYKFKNTNPSVMHRSYRILYAINNNKKRLGFFLYKSASYNIRVVVLFNNKSATVKTRLNVTNMKQICSA